MIIIKVNMVKGKLNCFQKYIQRFIRVINSKCKANQFEKGGFLLLVDK